MEAPRHFTHRQMDGVSADPRLIRNRRKIEAMVENAETILMPGPRRARAAR